MNFLFQLHFLYYIWSCWKMGKKASFGGMNSGQICPSVLLGFGIKAFFLAQAANLNPAQIFHSFLSLKPYKVGTGPFSSGFSLPGSKLGKIFVFLLENGCLIINFRPKRDRF